MTGPHSNCTPEGGEEGRRESGSKSSVHHSDWRFTFGISIDELALRYDTCLRREKRREREVREKRERRERREGRERGERGEREEKGERGEREKREERELDVMYSGHN